MFIDIGEINGESLDTVAETASDIIGGIVKLIARCKACSDHSLIIADSFLHGRRHKAIAYTNGELIGDTHFGTKAQGIGGCEVLLDILILVIIRFVDRSPGSFRCLSLCRGTPAPPAIVIVIITPIATVIIAIRTFSYVHSVIGLPFVIGRYNETTSDNTGERCSEFARSAEREDTT